mgnify:CR=1 FL=1
MKVFDFFSNTRPLKDELKMSMSRCNNDLYLSVMSLLTGSGLRGGGVAITLILFGKCMQGYGPSSQRHFP